MFLGPVPEHTGTFPFGGLCGVCNTIQRCINAIIMQGDCLSRSTKRRSQQTKRRNCGWHDAHTKNHEILVPDHVANAWSIASRSICALLWRSQVCTQCVVREMSCFHNGGPLRQTNNVRREPRIAPAVSFLSFSSPSFLQISPRSVTKSRSAFPTLWQCAGIRMPLQVPRANGPRPITPCPLNSPRTQVHLPQAQEYSIGGTAGGCLVHYSTSQCYPSPWPHAHSTATLQAGELRSHGHIPTVAAQSTVGNEHIHKANHSDCTQIQNKPHLHGTPHRRWQPQRLHTPHVLMQATRCRLSQPATASGIHPFRMAGKGE